MKVLVVFAAALAVSAAWSDSSTTLTGYTGYPYTASWTGAYPYYSTYSAAPVTYSAPITYTTGYPYAAYPYAHHATYAAPAVASSQYHAQDAIGGYTYGYADGLSTKHESKNALGGTVGSYSYLDSNHELQTVNYVADAGGFRVSGTNLPVAPVADLEAPEHTLVGPEPVEDTAEVKAARAEHERLFAEAAAAAAADATPVVAAAPEPAAAPVPVEDTAEVKAARAEFEQLYAEAAAAAAADATPSVDTELALAAPEPVMDTAEVKAARAEHARLFAEAAAAAEAAPDTDGPAYGLAYADYTAHPLAYSGLAYSALNHLPYTSLGYSTIAHQPTYTYAPKSAFSYGFSSAHAYALPYAQHAW